MGRFIKLPGVNPPADRPLVDVLDPILPETGGALMLVDLMHPSEQHTASLDIGGQLVPNIARAQALAVIGRTDPATVTPKTNGSTAGTSGGKGILERTAKGGIHFAVSPTLADASTGFLIWLDATAGQPALDLLAYLRSTTHQLYMSTWTRTTRVGPSVSNNNPDVSSLTSSAQPGNNRRIILSAYGYNTPLNVGRAPALKSGFGTPDIGPHLYNTFGSSWVGTQPTDASGTRLRVFAAGGQAVNGYTDTLRRARESLIFYRFYLEDLTVSGRTYAQVDAIDNEMFTRDVLTPGGRYYGDTFTNPNIT